MDTPQLTTGAWLVPNLNERATTSIWTRQAARAETQPDLVDQLVEGRTTAHHLAQAAGVNPFPDTAAAIAAATARQGLPPRHAVHPQAFPAATDRPTAPLRGPGRTTPVGR